MVIVKIRPGLGNQMFFYAAARGLQEQIGGRLCLDYSEYGINDFGKPETDHGENCEAAFQQLNLAEHEVIFSREEFLKRAGEQGIQYYNLRKKLRRVLKFSTRIMYYRYECDREYDWNKEGFFFVRNGYIDIYPEQLRKENAIMNGYFQSEKYFFDIKEQIKKELRVKESVQNRNEELLNMICETNAVCVHIRRGDVVINGKGPCPDEYYHEGMRYIKEKTEDAKFFVFSDDPDYVRQMSIMPKDAVFVNQGNSAIEDMRLMYNCKHYVISNSTYSWWAQYLSNSKEKIVVAPKPWTRRFPSELVSGEWKRISIRS